jgi:hypothetical protein
VRFGHIPWRYVSGKIWNEHSVMITEKKAKITSYIQTDLMPLFQIKFCMLTVSTHSLYYAH